IGTMLVVAALTLGPVLGVAPQGAHAASPVGATIDQMIQRLQSERDAARVAYQASLAVKPKPGCPDPAELRRALSVLLATRMDLDAASAAVSAQETLLAQLQMAWDNVNQQIADVQARFANLEAPYIADMDAISNQLAKGVTLSTRTLDRQRQDQATVDNL